MLNLHYLKRNFFNFKSIVIILSDSYQDERTATQLRVKKYSVAWSAGIALHKVVRIKHVTRATVNEVLLAGVAGAIRALLQGCGVRHPPDLKASAKVLSHPSTLFAQIRQGEMPNLWNQ